MAEWHFDEGVGSVLADSSGNGNDGVIHGATWVEGTYGGALSFDGVDDYVDVGRQPELINFGTEDFTVEAWEKSTSTSTDLQAILAYLTTEAVNNDRYVLQITRSTGGANANKIRFAVGDERQSAAQAIYSDSVIAGDRLWHHIVGERKRGILYIYIYILTGFNRQIQQIVRQQISVILPTQHFQLGINLTEVTPVISTA